MCTKVRNYNCTITVVIKTHNVINMQDCEIAGYRIPEGMSVVYCAYLANRDQAVFSEPDSFKPERWSHQYVLEHS